MIEPQILASEANKILSILKCIIEQNEDTTPLIDHPVLIGSRAAKWHISSFRKPNDWDLVATLLQSVSFISSVKSSASFKDIKLVYYSGGGLKIVGKCTERSPSTDGKSIAFDIELVSDKVDLRKMKQDLKKKKIYDPHKNGFERPDNALLKTSALMILELCHDVKDKTLFPLLQNFPCIVAPLKILEALKTSHIYWPADFHKNIEDLHLLRSCCKMSFTQPLCSPQRDKSIELMLKARIKETEIIRGIPASHINLNMTNEEFLDHDEDLLIQRRIPHDDIHELVKYGDHPIYDGLKFDKV